MPRIGGRDAGIKNKRLNEANIPVHLVLFRITCKSGVLN